MISQMSDRPEENSTSRVESESHENGLSRRGTKEGKERLVLFSRSDASFLVASHLFISEALQYLSSNRREGEVSDSEV